MECITPLIPASFPLQSLSATQASLVYIPSTSSMHFAVSYLCFSPTMTGLMPGCLSRPMNLPTTMYQYTAHGGWWFAIHSEKFSTITIRYALDSPDCKS